VPASAADVARVTELLGREPRAQFEVVVRAADGTPVVIRNAPLLDDGTPMPTAATRRSGTPRSRSRTRGRVRRAVSGVHGWA